MASAKPSKNNPTNKKGTQKTNIVLSNECEACTAQCSKGLRYIENIKKGKCGNGIVCQKSKTQ